MTPLERIRIEKAAADCGFEREPVVDGAGGQIHVFADLANAQALLSNHFGYLQACRLDRNAVVLFGSQMLSCARLWGGASCLISVSDFIEPQHINMLGRYSFSVPDSVVRGELRPLRDTADGMS